VVVHAAQPRRAQQALVALPGVLSVAQIGNTLRVLTAGNHDAVSRLRDALRGAGLDAEVEAGEPNLEDVFVSATRGRPSREEAA
jgi:ABC-2 type transport system ATP-binding protein